MIKLFTTLFLFICIINLHVQSQSNGFNQALADSLGADEYGMKMYVLVILKTGKNKEKDKKIVDSLFAGHMKNIGRMVELGKLTVAGPMSTNKKNYRGIFILNVPTIAEAEGLLETDPAVKSKLLEAELYGWYGSAALPLYLPSHEKVQKTHF